MRLQEDGLKLSDVLFDARANATSLIAGSVSVEAGKLGALDGVGDGARFDDPHAIGVLDGESAGVVDTQLPIEKRDTQYSLSRCAS